MGRGLGSCVVSGGGRGSRVEGCTLKFPSKEFFNKLVYEEKGTKNKT